MDRDIQLSGRGRRSAPNPLPLPPAKKKKKKKKRKVRATVEICVTLAVLGLTGFIVSQLFSETSIFRRNEYTYFTVDRRPSGTDKSDNPRYKGIAYETKMY